MVLAFLIMVTAATLVSPQSLAEFDDFEFLVNSDKCGYGRPVYAVFLVASHPSHRDLRRVIRSTWSNLEILGYPIRVVFPFGYLGDGHLQHSLESESAYHGDIIQGNFVDGFYNMTLRDLMALRWVWQSCPQALFAVHIDDDTSMNIFVLLNILQRDFRRNPDFIGCFYLYQNAEVHRDGIYAVDRDAHPDDIYDDYCSGWMYVVTPFTARALDVAALTVPSYWMNDAYITGTLVKAINRIHNRINIIPTQDYYDMEQIVNNWGKVEKTTPNFSLGPNNRNISLALLLHACFQANAIKNGIPMIHYH